MNEHTLILDEYEKIFFNIPCPIAELVGDDKVPFYFQTRDEVYLVSRSFIDDTFVVLLSLLKNAVNNTLQLDTSINQDIGFMWNRLMHNDPGFKYTENRWVGLKYSLWHVPGSVQPGLASWIYNDADGNIVFEITENYFWHHLEPDKGNNYISYERFMQHYKPYFVRIISPDTAQRWIAQAESWLTIIADNEQRYNKSR